jgi:glycosyltransferase involved in cell wall biosynthesis
MSSHGRIRILRVIARMNVGGPALQVVELVRGLEPLRFDSRLLTGAVDTGEADYVTLRAPGVPHELVPGLGRSPNPAGDIRALTAIVREIRAFQPHIVHTHTAKAGVLGRLAARTCQVPATVHTFHGHVLHSYFSPPVSLAVRQVERTLAHITTTLVAVGCRVRDELLQAGIGRPDQFRVVPPGVPSKTPPNRDVARAQLGLAGEVPVVAFVGRLTAVKRPDRFVDMARIVGAHLPATTFLVVGDGERGRDTRERAIPLGDKMKFLGFRSDVEAVYAASDVVVITSDNEGMPVSLIEAAMAGIPAVTTDVGSAREVVDETTGVVVPRDAHQLAHAVERLLRDESMRSTMGRAAAHAARDRFSPRRLVANTEQIYLDLAARRGFG